MSLAAPYYLDSQSEHENCEIISSMSEYDHMPLASPYYWDTQSERENGEIISAMFEYAHMSLASPYYLDTQSEHENGEIISSMSEYDHSTAATNMSLAATYYFDAKREHKNGEIISSMFEYDHSVTAKNSNPDVCDVKYSQIYSGYAAALADGNLKRYAFAACFTAAEYDIAAIRPEHLQYLFFALVKDFWVCDVVAIRRLDTIIFCDICEDSFSHSWPFPISGHTICADCLSVFDGCTTCNTTLPDGATYENEFTTQHIHCRFLSPYNSSNDLSIVYEFLKANDFKNALLYAKMALEEYPRSYRILTLISEIHYLNGDYRYSLFYADRAIELRAHIGKYSQAYYRRGLALFQLKQYKDALLSLYKAMCISYPMMISHYFKLKELICESLRCIIGDERRTLFSAGIRAKFLCEDLENELMSWAQLPAHNRLLTPIMDLNWVDRDE